jgi:hypothetical protein
LAQIPPGFMESVSIVYAKTVDKVTEPIVSISMTSLYFCKINQAAAFLRKSSGNATSLRHKDASRILSL